MQKQKEKWVTITFDLFAVGRTAALIAGIGAFAFLLYLGGTSALWDVALTAAFSIFFILTGRFFDKLKNSLPLRIERWAAYAVYAATLAAVSSAQYLLFNLPLVHIHWIGPVYDVLLAASNLLLWAAFLLTLPVRIASSIKGIHLTLLAAMLFSVKEMAVWCKSVSVPTNSFMPAAAGFLLPVLAGVVSLLIWFASAFTTKRENRSCDREEKLQRNP